jgi:hypothetical protein
MGAYDTTIVDYAQQNNVDPALALAVAQAESGGQQYDSRGNLLTSPAGAVGVMQLEPGTAAAYGSDPSNPAENIDAGTAYLGDLINQYGDQGTALAAYNWGPGNLNRAIAQYGTAPTPYGGHTVPAWFVHAPNETQNYVMGILGSTGFSSGAGSSSLPALPAGSPAAVSNALRLSPGASSLMPSSILPGLSAASPWLIAAAVVAGFLVILDVSNA